ncbi:MAG: hypothetical protein KH198_08395 [Oscillibacter sp.]|nr:hypothetical protein [Oscillibacter sp.]
MCQVENLITEYGVNIFYVGNNGQFDHLVAAVLRELKSRHPQISYSIVLAYLPEREKEHNQLSYTETIYPEGLEDTPPRFAISKRNKWMVQQSEYVIAYVEHSFGGAAQFTEYARKKHRTVINLADLTG